MLLRAVRDAFGTFLKPGKYPIGVLKLDLPAQEVDVNVHPQKSEVRFREPGLIFSSIHFSIKKALGERATYTSVEPVQTWGSANFKERFKSRLI